MLINRNKTAPANIVDLININNPDAKLTEQKIILSIPIPRGNHLYPEANTLLNITGNVSAGVEGNEDLWYTRLGVKSGVRNFPESVYVFRSDTMAQLKLKVAMACGLVNSEIVLKYLNGEVINDNNPISFTNAGLDITIETIDDSLLYVKDSARIHLEVPQVLIPISALVSKQILNGLNLPPYL